MPEIEDGEEIVRFQVRCPADIYQELVERTKKSRRSINAEIIYSLERYFSDDFQGTQYEQIVQVHQDIIRLSEEMNSRMNTLVAESPSRYNESIDGIPVTAHGQAKGSPTGLEGRGKAKKTNNDS